MRAVSADFFEAQSIPDQHVCQKTYKAYVLTLARVKYSEIQFPVCV
jgi:hypothetical protein